MSLKSIELLSAPSTYQHSLPLWPQFLIISSLTTPPQHVLLTSQLAIHTLSTEEDKESIIDYEQRQSRMTLMDHLLGSFSMPQTAATITLHVPNPLCTKVAKCV